MTVPTNPAQSQAESANPDFWDGAMSGGLVVNGVMRDIFAQRDAALVGSPVYDTSPQGPILGFNRSGRSGQTIDAPYLNLDNRGALSYWIYGTFTGSPSGDEDTLGLQWSGLQGDVDNDARRVLFRYASNSNALQWFAYFTNFTTTNHSAPANISDGLPHLIGFSFSRPGVTLFVDDQVYEFTADGDLANLSTAKHPEILGGHTVTRAGRPDDSPRFDLYSWGMLSRGLSSAEIQTLASEPHAAFVPADAGQTVDVQTVEFATAAASASAHVVVFGAWQSQARATDRPTGAAEIAAGVTESVAAGDSDNQLADAIAQMQSNAVGDVQVDALGEIAASILEATQARESWVGRVDALAEAMETAQPGDTLGTEAQRVITAATQQGSAASARFTAAVQTFAEARETAFAADESMTLGQRESIVSARTMAQHALIDAVAALARIGATAQASVSVYPATGVYARVVLLVSAQTMQSARSATTATWGEIAKATASFWADEGGRGYLTGSITLVSALSGGVKTRPALNAGVSTRPGLDGRINIKPN